MAQQRGATARFLFLSHFSSCSPNVWASLWEFWQGTEQVISLSLPRPLGSGPRRVLCRKGHCWMAEKLCSTSTPCWPLLQPLVLHPPGLYRKNSLHSMSVPNTSSRHATSKSNFKSLKAPFLSEFYIWLEASGPLFGWQIYSILQLLDLTSPCLWWLPVRACLYRTPMWSPNGLLLTSELFLNRLLTHLNLYTYILRR